MQLTISQNVLGHQDTHVQVNLDMTDHCLTDFSLWRTICLVPVRCISSIHDMYTTDFAYETDQISWSHWVCHIHKFTCISLCIRLCVHSQCDGLRALKTFYIFNVKPVQNHTKNIYMRHARYITAFISYFVRIMTRNISTVVLWDRDMPLSMDIG